MKKDFRTEFTLQSIEHEIRSYIEQAKEYKTTVAQQSQQHPLEVNVAVFKSATELSNYEFGHTLGYTQHGVSLSSTKKDFEAEVKKEIRNWFGLSNRFCIQVNFDEPQI